jgi:putative transposase
MLHIENTSSILHNEITFNDDLFQDTQEGYIPEKVINRLREAEVLLSQGNTIGVVSKKIGVSDFTYYCWRKEYGGMRVEQAKRWKDLGVENAQLKKLVADLIETRVF